MINKIINLVEVKTHEVFAEIQKELSIKSGDIDPMQWIRLEEEEQKLSELIKEILVFQCLTNGEESRAHIGDLLTPEERSRIYYEVKEERVTEDTMARAKDNGEELEECEAAMVADRYVNQGDYDYGLSYWENLDNLIDEVKANRDVPVPVNAPATPVDTTHPMDEVRYVESN